MTTTKNVDANNLRQVILDSPKQFEIGFELTKKLSVGKNFKSICISGMGGSSFPTDAVKTYVKYLQKKDSKKNKGFRILKNRDYSLPLEAYDNCLNLFISYSGNTEETLTALDEAIKNNLPSLGIANGGKLLEVCQKNNIPTITVPEISQPRYALGYFFSIILGILTKGNLIENTSQEILSSVDKLQKDTIRLEKKGKLLAEKLYKKTPVIHTTDQFKSVGRIWKIKINENSKTPCFYNYYPELNHNEMVGFTLPQAKFHFITLVDKNGHPQIIKRMKIASKLFTQKGIANSLVDMPGGENMFLSIFSSLALGDWVSYYLALNYKQDPTPVQMVEDFKKMLK